MPAPSVNPCPMVRLENRQGVLVMRVDLREMKLAVRELGEWEVIVGPYRSDIQRWEMPCLDTWLIVFVLLLDLFYRMSLGRKRAKEGLVHLQPYGRPGSGPAPDRL